MRADLHPTHPPSPWAALRPVPARHAHAARLERRWRWPLVAALLATIPAFYAELIHIADDLWSAAIYLGAATVLALSLVHIGRHTGAVRDHLAAQLLDLALVLGLLVAALLPPSSGSQAVLAWRLGVAFLTLGRLVWSLKHWVTQGGVVYLLAVAFGVLLLSGVGFWILEPRTPTLADGLWLAFTSAATVGYGDIVPSTPASRIFSVFVVLLGYGVLTLATAALATAWIETQEQRVEREILSDLHRQMASLHGEIAGLREQLAKRDAGDGAGAPPG